MIVCFFVFDKKLSLDPQNIPMELFVEREGDKNVEFRFFDVFSLYHGRYCSYSDGTVAPMYSWSRVTRTFFVIETN